MLNIKLTSSFYSSTVSNASSPLLRLPQELKDRIYHFVYGGNHIHVLFNDDKRHYVGPGYKPRIVACDEVTAVKVGNNCHWRCLRRGKGLPVASLGTCRQLYHAAKNVLYSAGDFTLDNSKLVGLFIRRLDDVNHCILAMRSVQLHVSVYDRNGERAWDNTFRFLAETLKNLRCVRIMLYERN